jgi:hypothetical protein
MLFDFSRADSSIGKSTSLRSLKSGFESRSAYHGGVAEMADAADSKSVAFGRVGSTPSTPTIFGIPVIVSKYIPPDAIVLMGKDTPRPKIIIGSEVDTVKILEEMNKDTWCRVVVIRGLNSIGQSSAF